MVSNENFISRPKGFEFAQAGRFIERYLDLETSITVTEFRKTATFYQENMARIRGMHFLLCEMVFFASVTSRALGNVPFHSGVPGDDAEQSSNVDTSASFRANWLAYKRTFNPIQSPNAPWNRDEILRIGSNFIEHSTNDEVRLTHSGLGITGLYYAMILQSYAAFESLAEDLWIESVNRHPQLVLETSKDSSLSFQNLSEYGFDLKGNMGSALIKHKKVPFSNVHEFKSAYKGTFGDAIARIFEKHKEIYSIEKTRHLIAHRCGRVDKKYIAEFSKFKPDWLPALEDGVNLDLNGGHVAKIINVCVDLSVDLIEAVNRWTTQNELKRTRQNEER